MRVRVPRRRTAFSLGALLLVTGAVCGAQGAMLVVENVRYNEEGGAWVPIRLVAGADERVAALQFDVRFDADGLSLDEEKAASPGAVAESAEKSVNTACTQPGRLRVIVAGLNQNVMESGEVAVVRFERPEIPEGTVPRLALENVLISDPKGQAVPVGDGTATLRTATPGDRELAARTDGQAGDVWRVPLFFGCLVVAAAMLWRARRRSQVDKKPGSGP